MSVGGIPLLKIVAPLSFLAMAFLVYDTLKYPDLALSGVSSHRWYVPAFMLATAAFGLLVYYGARVWQRIERRIPARRWATPRPQLHPDPAKA